MNTSLYDELYLVWQHLAKRYDWQLAQHPPSVVDRACYHYNQISSKKIHTERLKMAVIYAYGELVYQGLKAENERAAHELYLVCFNKFRSSVSDQQQAQDLAQVAVYKTIKGLDTFQGHSILYWVLRVCQRDANHANKRAQKTQNDTEVTENLVAATAIEEEVETKQQQQQVFDLINKFVTDPLNRAIMFLFFLKGEAPRAIAERLSIPVSQVKVRKSRVLKKLKEDQDFLSDLRKLSGLDD